MMDRILAGVVGVGFGVATSIWSVVHGMERHSYGDVDSAASGVIVAFGGVTSATYALRWWSGARALHATWMLGWFAFLAFLLTRLSSKEVPVFLFVIAVGAALLAWGWRFTAPSRKSIEVSTMPAQPAPRKKKARKRAARSDAD